MRHLHGIGCTTLPRHWDSTQKNTESCLIYRFAYLLPARWIYYDKWLVKMIAIIYILRLCISMNSLKLMPANLYSYYLSHGSMVPCCLSEAKLAVYQLGRVWLFIAGQMNILWWILIQNDCNHLNTSIYVSLRIR